MRDARYTRRHHSTHVAETRRATGRYVVHWRSVRLFHPFAGLYASHATHQESARFKIAVPETLEFTSVRLPPCCSTRSPSLVTTALPTPLCDVFAFFFFLIFFFFFFIIFSFSDSVAIDGDRDRRRLVLRYIDHRVPTSAATRARTGILSTVDKVIARISALDCDRRD